ncbi:hypothetical protein E1B28_012581 [Marasmius oreades]|uniref:Uncharacterized protein n=1 Tax=Marasmius oreades TaxID=181124 RepID=A0A9P7UNE3_9AGAR|nr:uncharacterized protein E1B28_012581 [Marasmius oreades]KAG7088607.1 hypothetical protein E1B28_012581 [Marasmius oreades]
MFSNIGYDPSNLSIPRIRGILLPRIFPLSRLLPPSSTISNTVNANSSEGKGTGGAVEIGDAGTTVENSRVHEDSDRWGPPELTQSLSSTSTTTSFLHQAGIADIRRFLSIHAPPFRSGSHSQSGSPSIPFSRSPTPSTTSVAPPITSTSATVFSSPSPSDLETLGRSTMTGLSASYQTLTNQPSLLEGPSPPRKIFARLIPVYHPNSGIYSS